MAAKSYADITAAYTAHRAVIDDIVKQTNDDNAATEAEAKGRDKFFTWILWGISALVFVLVGTGIGGIAKGVIRPITSMTGVMQRLAGGELEIEILPWAARTRSVPWLARWKFSRKMPCASGQWKPNKPSPPRKAEGRKATMLEVLRVSRGRWRYPQNGLVRLLGNRSCSR